MTPVPSAAPAAPQGFFERRPEAALAGVTFLWGSTFIVTKDLVRSVAPLPYVAIRFSLAALILLAIFPAARRPSRALLRDGAILGGGQALGLLLQVFGQVYTSASKSAFVTSLSTALTPLLGLALYHAQPRRAQAAGALLATVGLGLLTWPGADAAWNRGDLFSLGCAVVYAFVIVETARRAPRHAYGPLTAWQTATGALVFLCLFALAHGLLALLPVSARPHLLSLEARAFAPDARQIFQILYMALVCTVFTFLAQTWSMRRMTATHAAVVFALEPVFATGLAIAVEGGSEWPGPRGAVGALLILLGVMASETRWWERTAA